MTTIAEKNILVKDTDGYRYAIPPNMEQEFIRIKEACIDAEFGSNEWQDAHSEMEETFGFYLKSRISRHE